MQTFYEVKIKERGSFSLSLYMFHEKFIGICIYELTGYIRRACSVFELEKDHTQKPLRNRNISSLT